MKKILSALFIIGFTALPFMANAQPLLSGIGKEAVERNRNRLDFYLEDQGGGLGNPVFLRSFIDSEKLELWQIGKNGKFKHIRTYKLCNDANNLKIRPSTGVYNINTANFTTYLPNGPVLLTNYPNSYDRNNKPIKASLNIAPSCRTTFGLGLTDTEMGELFTILYFSVKNGQNNIQLHVFPFEMNWIAMVGAKFDKNYKKYQQLAPIYNYFEGHKTVPKVSISKNGYRIIK